MSSDEISLNSATGVELNLALAGAGSRAYAYTIDWHIRVVVVLVWVGVWFAIYVPGSLNEARGDSTALAWLFGVSALLYSLYHVVCELVTRGSSPGKKMAGIRCVNVAGQNPSNGQVILRNIFRLIDGLPFIYTVGVIAILMTRDQVRLGDMVAGTRMIQLAENSADTLRKLDEIQDSKLGHKEAEFVQRVLQRWATLSWEKKLEIGNAVLERHNMASISSPHLLKEKLMELLER